MEKARTTLLDIFILFLVCILYIITFFIAGIANADTRYCYAVPDIPRDSAGVIIRSSKPIYAFRKEHPCPVTLKTTGACPGWSINHVIPLASGGCDILENMQWLPNEIKSCAGKFCIDRFERIIYSPTFGKL